MDTRKNFMLFLVSLRLCSLLFTGVNLDATTARASDVGSQSTVGQLIAIDVSMQA
jgi:hypothetical protein